MDNKIWKIHEKDKTIKYKNKTNEISNEETDDNEDLFKDINYSVFNDKNFDMEEDINKNSDHFKNNKFGLEFYGEHKSLRLDKKIKNKISNNFGFPISAIQVISR